MTAALKVLSAGPGLSLQDHGRPGGMGIGLSAGGAADRDALLEGIALLGNAMDAAALEMAAFGGRFRATGTLRIALTGAEMRASLNGTPFPAHTTAEIREGDMLDIGAATAGVYGYLHVAGGFDAPLLVGGRGYHRIAGLGAPVRDGDTLAALPDPDPGARPIRLAARPAATAPLRVMPGPQTDLFPAETRAAFEAARFIRSPRGNRQGVRLDHEGAPFSTGGQLTLVSDFITPGDIQMTGDGTPYVLLADCQTMGGYPRIGTVLPADLPRVAQAAPGATLRFRFVTLEEAEAGWQSDEARLAALRRRCEPLIRDPREMRDLLSYELVDRPPPDVAG